MYPAFVYKFCCCCVALLYLVECKERKGFHFRNVEILDLEELIDKFDSAFKKAVEKIEDVNYKLERIEGIVKQFQNAKPTNAFDEIAHFFTQTFYRNFY